MARTQKTPAPLSPGVRPLKLKTDEIWSDSPILRAEWVRVGEGGRGKRQRRRRRGGERNSLYLVEPQMMSPTTTAAIASTIIRMHIFFLELRWEERGDTERFKVRTLT